MFCLLTTLFLFLPLLLSLLLLQAEEAPECQCHCPAGSLPGRVGWGHSGLCILPRLALKGDRSRELRASASFMINPGLLQRT